MVAATINCGNLSYVCVDQIGVPGRECLLLGSTLFVKSLFAVHMVDSESQNCCLVKFMLLWNWTGLCGWFPLMGKHV